LIRIMKLLVDKVKEKYWSPVDFYVGGAEHATRHLIYARFWHKFLFDIGVVNFEEPFKALQHVGLVLGSDGKKISKRLNNGANPLDVAAEYGADALRCYENFMGPFNQPCVWSNTGPLGVRRFLDKTWSLSEKFSVDSSKEIKNILHKTIKKVSEDIADFKLNTCISSLMILANAIEEKGVAKEDYAQFIQILSPFAPHLAEEIWREKLGNQKSIFKSAWPIFDPELIKDETVNLIVQVNGKLRATISVPAEISQDEAVKLAGENENVKKYLDGKEIIKIIFVAGKLLNIVVK
jgi:leucyl-tRNA synthetase